MSWHIVQTAKHGVELEWWSFREDTGHRAEIVLRHDGSSPLTVEQWGLIKRQFENMGIAPRQP